MTIIITGPLNAALQKAREISTQFERGTRWRYRKVDLGGDRWRIIMQPEFSQYPYYNASKRTRAAQQASRLVEDVINLPED